MGHASTALAAAGLVALAGVAGWAIMGSVEEDGEPGLTPRQPAEPPAKSTDDAVWCGGDGTNLDATCDYGQARCETRRAALRTPTAECTKRDQACFIIATVDGKHRARFCTVNFDECEQARVRQGGDTVSVTACAVRTDTAPDSMQTFLNLRGPETCIGGRGRRGPCQFRECYEAGPDAHLCYSTAGDCEAGRQLAKAAAPCRLMP